jgi:cell division topological specificity factor
MANFLDRLINRKPKSAVQAKERLKFVLIHDRSEIPPGVIDLLKDEIIDVISRRIEIDPDSVRIEISQEGRQQRLIADIPLRPVKRRKIG